MKSDAYFREAIPGCHRREQIRMETAEKKSCTYRGETHKEGDMRCDDYDCFACIEGEWVNQKDLETQSCD